MSDLFDCDKNPQVAGWEELLAELRGESLEHIVFDLKQTAWEVVRDSDRFYDVGDMQDIANIYSQIVSDEVYQCIASSYPDIEVTFTKLSSGRVTNLCLNHASFAPSDFELVLTPTEFTSYLYSVTGYNKFYDILQQLKLNKHDDFASGDYIPSGVTKKVFEQDLESLITEYAQNDAALTDILKTNEYYYSAHALPDIARKALGAGLLLKAVLEENLSNYGMADKISVQFNNTGLNFSLSASSSCDDFPIEILRLQWLLPI